MPITPLHVGPALPLKRTLGRRFSLSSFVLSQVLLDIEPGLKLFGLVPEYGGLHTGHTWLIGAVVGLAAAVVGGCGWRRGQGLRLRGKGLRLRGQGLRLRGQTPRLWISTTSAAVGVVSHLLLDGLYHADVAAGLGCPGLSGVVPQGWLDTALLVALVVGLVAMTLSSKRP